MHLQFTLCVYLCSMIKIIVCFSILNYHPKNWQVIYDQKSRLNGGEWRSRLFYNIYNYFKLMIRKETKYKISNAVFLALKSALPEFMEEDFFSGQKIHNIYFDNDIDELIYRSIAKPNFKEKMRLRTYELNGQLSASSYIEIKKKYNGVVYKRRKKLSTETANKYIKDKKFNLVKGQIMQEIEFFIKKHKCYPKLYLSYDRFSYYAKEDNIMRITFDANIINRSDNLGFFTSDSDSNSLIGDMLIMEVKTEKAYPFWLLRLLSQHKIYPTSFSKYGEIFTKNFQSFKEVATNV